MSISTHWRRLSLAMRFLIAGSLVLVPAMGTMGYWVAERIKVGVSENTALATAAYMDSVLAPLIQELATSATLQPETVVRVDKLLVDTEIGRRVHSFKIWKEAGRVVFASRPELVGRSFPPTPNLRKAWKGEVASEFDDLVDEEDELERAAGIPLLEIYAPIRASGSDRVIAVAEFYAKGDVLVADLKRATLQSWLVVGLTTLTVMAALFGIVLGGSRTINHQRLALEDQVQQLSHLADQNAMLHTRAERAYRRISTLNERFLRRVGADIHDGPAQLIGLALLRLDSLETPGEPGLPRQTCPKIEEIRSVLKESISEIRRISSGLALPEIETASTREAIELAVRAHERRTGSSVERDLSAAVPDASNEIKTALYRFVQEGLNNAFRHAGGMGQQVIARPGSGGIEVAVVDKGKGMIETRNAAEQHGIGLVGLKDRIEALEGSFSIRPNEPRGTMLVATFDRHALEKADG